MDRKLKSLIPKVPNWRWVLYHAMVNREHDQLNEKFRGLSRRLFEDHEQKTDAFEAVGLLDLLQHEFDQRKGKDGSEDVERALELKDQGRICQVVEDMLSEHCDPEWIQDAVYNKFKESLSQETIEHYKDLFWDVDFLNAYEFAEYWLEQGGRDRPDPPPVQGAHRPEYVAYQHGVEVDINPEDMLKDVMTQAYFRSKELTRFGMAADDEVLKYQKNFMSAFKVLKDKNGDQSGELPKVFQREIVYASGTAAEPDELEGYDPEEDSGYEERQ